MSKPRIEIQPELTGPYPSSFWADANRIGETMEEVAGLSAEITAATALSFRLGSPADDVFIRQSPNSFVINMRSLQSLIAKDPYPLPKAWHNTFPENDLNARVHFAIAGVIGGLKAEQEVGPIKPNLPQTLGLMALCGAAEGSVGYFLSGGSPIFTGIGGLLGLRRGVKASLDSTTTRAAKKVWPKVEAFLNDERVPAALNGAVRFEYRH